MGDRKSSKCGPNFEDNSVLTVHRIHVHLFKYNVTVAIHTLWPRAPLLPHSMVIPPPLRFSELTTLWLVSGQIGSKEWQTLALMSTRVCLKLNRCHRQHHAASQGYGDVWEENPVGFTRSSRG